MKWDVNTAKYLYRSKASFSPLAGVKGVARSDGGYRFSARNLPYPPSAEAATPFTRYALKEAF